MQNITTKKDQKVQYLECLKVTTKSDQVQEMYLDYLDKFTGGNGDSRSLTTRLKIKDLKIFVNQLDTKNALDNIDKPEFGDLGRK